MLALALGTMAAPGGGEDYADGDSYCDPDGNVSDGRAYACACSSSECDARPMFLLALMRCCLLCVWGRDDGRVSDPPLVGSCEGDEGGVGAVAGDDDDELAA